MHVYVQIHVELDFLYIVNFNYCSRTREENMESNNEIKVRKGAWTKEEDILLTKCIQNFGEGKWHLVPPRAGLNRCRKSCRMRWLNYLKPNVKRGYFDPAEVELLRRLHKLLGNRWSLIAGRIPGRTANDIKNFWNTYICKKQPSKTVAAAAAHTTTNILIKPRPRRFTISTSHSQSQLLLSNNADVESKNVLPLTNDDDEDQDQDQEVHECNQWWREMLQMSENGEGNDCHTDHDGFMSDLFMDFHVWGDII